MKPGRELDALIAERVMGLTVVCKTEWGPLEVSSNPNQARSSFPCPCYSTDIAAAWEVVDAIRYNHGGGLLELYRNGDDTWAARFDDRDLLTTEDTAPMAICLAALKAVGVDPA